ncbi:MAG TPA: NAD(P)-dependent oxidoreductase [Candidatus Limnocylindrales bacterium]|nr:NAD(P)-dependent oxidoreductase [Candidatus Limnocylindrales bacterium]
MSRLSVLNQVSLLPSAQQAIKELIGEDIEFPGYETETSQQALIERANDAEIILVSPGATINEDFLAACPNVKYVSLCGSSTANIDLNILKQRDITITTVTNYGDEPTAEFIFLQLGNLLRGLGKYQWRSVPHELMDKKLGIVGLGAVGKSVAHLALAYKMNVAYTGPHHKEEWEAKGLSYKDLETLLQESDFILLSGPGSTELLSAKDFLELCDGCVLIQASQGTVFDKDGFISWIKHEGNYAIFDYAAGEENYQAYHALDRVIFPKIVAGHTQETKERLGRKVVDNLQRYLAKELQ